MTKTHLPAVARDVYASRRKWKNPSGTQTYYAWRAMRQRCHNEKNDSWNNYGGRGITVCAKWVNNYDAFFEDMGEAPKRMSLERLNVNKGYFPENCVWATSVEQGRNRRNNKFLTFNGKTMCLSEWAEFLGIGTDTLHRRLNVYNMPIDKALTSGSLSQKWKHGTRRGYDRGCKCDECKAAHAAHHRAQRARRKARKQIAGELGSV
jgi:hypothetical protein